MSRFRKAVPIGIAILGIALIAGSSLSQTSKPAAQEHQHDVGGMAPLKPGPEHAVFQKAVGKWKAVNKMKMDPSQPAMVSNGIEEVKLICGGLWVEADYKSTSPEMPFEGHGVEGYDPKSKKYTGTWVDSWSTVPATYEGSVDASGKVFTYTMKGTDPMGNQAISSMQVTMVDDNTKVMRMYMGPKAEGDWMMEITYTRL